MKSEQVRFEDSSPLDQGKNGEARKKESTPCEGKGRKGYGFRKGGKPNDDFSDKLLFDAQEGGGAQGAVISYVLLKLQDKGQ